MTFPLTRRAALAGGLALGACAPNDPMQSRVGPIRAFPNFHRFADIEARIGGRVGVMAMWLGEQGQGAWLAHRHDERFPMCSTFKWLLAAAEFEMGPSHGRRLDDRLAFGEPDLLEYAPVAREHLARGWMTVEEACEAAVKLSDNTAANLLLKEMGGPGEFTAFLRGAGDRYTRLDRNEPGLNDVAPGDERDTTTPLIMAHMLRDFLAFERTLSPAHREKLIGWMVDSPTGRARLRAGLPSDWRVGDKTGTWNGQYNATNDVAVAWRPDGSPIVIASYLHCSIAEPAARNAAHAEIGRIIAEEWS